MLSEAVAHARAERDNDTDSLLQNDVPDDQDSQGEESDNEAMEAGLHVPSSAELLRHCGEREQCCLAAEDGNGAPESAVAEGSVGTSLVPVPCAEPDMEEETSHRWR